MKKLSIITLLIFFSVCFSSSFTNAQISEFGSFVSAGTEDAEKLLEAYLSPYINAFGASMSGGWYNTAKPHQLGGFDVTVTINTSIVSPDYREFNVNDLGLNNLQLAQGESETSPTVAGDNINGPLLQYNFADIGYSADAFELPKGTGLHSIPAPMASLAVGLMKNTEIMGRYCPRVGSDKGKVGLWGVGLKHDVKQWIPALEKAPVLNISIMGGYTKLKSFVAIEVDPETLGMEAYYDGTDPSVWDDQQLDFISTSFTGNLLVSADLPIVCFFGGVGFVTTKSNIQLVGNYPMIDGFENNGNPIVVAEPDPIDFEVKNQEGGVTKPRLNIGMRLKFGVFTLHGDYTRANYNVVTGGIGLSFR